MRKQGLEGDSLKGRRADGHSASLGVWFFGSILLVFFIGVFFFASSELPPYKHRQLGVLCALLCGLFVYFFVDRFELMVKTKKPTGWLLYRGLGGTSVFLIVLGWWSSPYSLVGIDEDLAEIKKDTHGLWTAQEEETRREIDALSPNLSAHEALDHAYRVLGQKANAYELIEVLGSYYACFALPERVFFRYPEWLFTLRHKTEGSIIEIRVADSRVSRPPIQLAESTTGVYYYIVIPEEYVSQKVKSGFEAVEGKEFPKGSTFEVCKFNEDNVATTSELGFGLKDTIPERLETLRFQVKARAQAVGRAKRGEVINGTRIQSFDGLMSIDVEILPVANPVGLRSFKSFSLSDWKLDIDEAAEMALGKGALARGPGSWSGWPGILRLYSPERDGEPFWHLPYGLKLGFFRMNAMTGEISLLEAPGVFRPIE